MSGSSAPSAVGAAALRRYASGDDAAFAAPLDLNEGTDFQRDVWKALRAIPYGEVRTYGQIAAALGRPNAARAVGAACGANPVPVIVPCHRVVAAGGGLGGFSGGLHWKKRLLHLEKSAFPLAAASR